MEVVQRKILILMDRRKLPQLVAAAIRIPMEHLKLHP